MILTLDLVDRLLTQGVSVSSRDEVRFPGESEALVDARTPLDAEALERLRRRRISSVSAVFSRKLLASVHRLEPGRYPLPQAVESVEEFSRRIRAIDFANRRSRYQRRLFLLDEPDGPDGEPILSYGAPLVPAEWDRCRARWPAGWPVAFRYSEHKILVFLSYSLRSRETRRTLQTQMQILKTLHDGLTVRREYVNLHNLSYYRDVLIVDDPAKLLETYEKEDVRLVLIGHEVTEASRNALVELKRFDPYARFMLTGSLDPAQEDVFLLAVETNYTRDNYMGPREA